jgi:Raf kinase inhibitor-like YbhB/YbcL family protein
MRLLLILIPLWYFQPALIVKSTEFADGHYIPARFTCAGTNINPTLQLEGIPFKTKSLALIVDDTESPNGEFVHWVMWNIPVERTIQENTATGIQGKNSNGQNKYFGPCPPNGIHSYNFKVFALDTKLNLADTSGKKALLEAMKGHILSQAQLKGLFKEK